MAGRPEDRAPRLDNPSEAGVLPDTQEGRDEGHGSTAASSSEPSQFTQVGMTPACPRCGSYVGKGVTHICPMPSTSSVIVPGGSMPVGQLRLTPCGGWEWRPW